MFDAAAMLFLFKMLCMSKTIVTFVHDCTRMVAIVYNGA